MEEIFFSILLPIASLVVTIGLPLLVIAGIVAALRKGVSWKAINLKQIYFSIISFVSLLVVFFSLLSLTESVLTLALRTHRYEWEKPKEDIARMTSLVIVSFPVWLFHWSRTRRIAYAEKAFLLYRIYLYVVMVIALIATLACGGLLVHQFIKLAMGIVEWAKAAEVRAFWKDVISAAINALLSFGLWFYHWRLVERVPREEG